MRRPLFHRFLALAALVWATFPADCRHALAAEPEQRTAVVGDQVKLDGTLLHTFTAPGTFRLFVPGVDLEYTVTATTPVPPDPVPPVEPDVIRLTVAMRTPVFLRAEGADARWDMPALPDTPARSYHGPFFAWAFDKQGVYSIVVTPGKDYLVTVGDPLPVTILKLPPGRQSIRRTLSVPTWVVAADVDNPPIINGGFTVEAPNCYFGTLKFDGDTEVNRSAIEIGRGGSAYIDDIDLGSIGSGIHAQYPTMVGVVGRHIRAGSGVRKYPFAMFAGHTFALYDFSFADYRGLEHAVRVDHNGGVAPRNGIIAYGTAARVNDNKEPLTIRRAEDVSVHHVTMKNGYAARFFYAKNDYASGTSRNIFVRWCTFESVPLYLYWSGSDGLTIQENNFIGLGGDAAIHYTAGNLRNVREIKNRRTGTGPMHKGEQGIPGWTYIP